MFFFLKFAIVLGGRGRQVCHKSFKVVIGNWAKNFDKQIVFAVHQCHSHSGPSEPEARNKICAYPPHTRIHISTPIDDNVCIVLAMRSFA